MRTLKYALTIPGVLWILFGCAGVPPAEQPASGGSRLEQAKSAAAGASGDLNAAFGGGTAVPQPAAPLPTIPKVDQPDGGSRPEWTSAPESVYPRTKYLAAVGYGGNRRQAEGNALGNLAGVFGQSVSSNISTVTRYSENVVSGGISSAENSEIQEAIQTSAAMESLIGAEITGYWFDGKNTHYAVAVMDKGKTARIYGDLIDSDQRFIAGLIDVPQADRSTLEGVARYNLAASIADADQLFATVLAVVDGPDRRSGMKSGDEYRSQGAKLAALIPVNVVVDKDSGGRITSAFTSVLSQAGFRAGNGGERYMLAVTVSFAPVDLPNPAGNKFTRYIVDANLTDTANKTVLFPFNISGREGHLSQTEAEERAYRAAVAKIAGDYGTALGDYLSGTMPKNK